MTLVVADTGDIDAIARLKPTDATTNPSLLLKAAQLPRFADTIAAIRAEATSPVEACHAFAVAVGTNIAKLIPGRVSTEVDARLSFDTYATIQKAQQLIEAYVLKGISPERILIKIAATWEGIEAARVLEKQGIQCNLTLVFNFIQAQACADAGVYLISPFVGRILDWHLANTSHDPATAEEDPGVQSVTAIYDHYKRCGYHTVVMGASFRNCQQIEALAGCDRLTISPELLDQLAKDTTPLERKLSPSTAQETPPPALTAAAFRYGINDDPMATEKLADGIRRFAADQMALEALFR
jgi:transaldolase